MSSREQFLLFFLKEKMSRKTNQIESLYSSFDKESAYNAGVLGLNPGLGRSPGEGKGYPLQYYGLENSMDCIVHGVAESDTPERLHVYHQRNC